MRYGNLNYRSTMMRMTRPLLGGRTWHRRHGALRWQGQCTTRF